ncbi:MAG: hypothetical protein A3F41_03160 [Coxiella sp. RIFCSPHIGHO2_12_FULL_44_14]|nr:MAG: hypothetical protein A3F41_03160 [Coxiella sp. RIFCSPHIGHO2_12_FULL_44_14]
MGLPSEMQLAILAHLPPRDLAAFGCMSQWAKERANRVAKQNLRQCFLGVYKNHMEQSGVNYISLFKETYNRMLDEAGKLNVVCMRVHEAIYITGEADKKECALLFVLLGKLRYGNEDNKFLIRLLLDHGAHVESNIFYYGSFLKMAAKLGNIEIVKLLLERGVDINAQNGQLGYTALMIDVRGGHIEMVRLLLDRGADIDRQTIRGMTALMLAAQHGRTEIAQLLLDRGADIDLKDSLHFTAHSHAVQRQQTEVAELLLHAQEQRKKAISVQPQPTAF